MNGRFTYTKMYAILIDVYINITDIVERIN